MAIAYDNSTASAYSGASSTTVTWSHTCSGTDRVLVVGVYTTNDNLSTVTYNGVSCTFIGKIAGTTDYIHLYYLINPASGANNVVATATSALLGYGQATSITGAKQSGQPDASATGANASTTNFTTSVTTVADNSWLVGIVYGGGTIVAGTGTTFRAQSVANVLGMMDSNGAKSPAGSYGLNATQSSSFMSMIVASFAPSVAANTGSGFFGLM